MSNLWDNLDPQQKRMLVQTYVSQQGNRTPENTNRASEQLANNPVLVERLAKDAGITEAEDEEVLQDEEDTGYENEIEANVDAAFEGEEEDDQQTGGLSKAAAPPMEDGESLADYVARLQGMLDTNEDPLNPGAREDPAARGHRRAILEENNVKFSRGL